MATRIGPIQNNQMENFSIGVDIENISRLEKVKNNKHFLNKIFSPAELKYCFRKSNPAAHLAARYAAKEAALKAIGSAENKKPTVLDYKKIIISNKKNGAPEIKFKGSRLKKFIAKISLSHCDDKAIAFVELTRR